MLTDEELEERITDLVLEFLGARVACRRGMKAYRLETECADVIINLVEDCGDEFYVTEKIRQELEDAYIMVRDDESGAGFRNAAAFCAGSIRVFL